MSFGNPYILTFKVIYDGMVSTNEAYFHMPKKSKKSNRITTYAVKSDKLKRLQSYFEEIFDKSINDDYIKLLSDLVNTKFYGIKILTIYSMPYNQYRDGDTTNYIKNYEDCIATRLRKFNKNLDDKNNLEYRAIKRYRCSDSEDWKITTVIYPIERDLKFRSEILELYCDNCKSHNHCKYNPTTDGLYCNKCGQYIGLKIDEAKSLYGITTTDNEHKCSVCGSNINGQGICTYCGINKTQYYELIRYFNEEEFKYEE